MDTFLTPTNLFLALVATTVVLTLATQWRLNLLALLAQYLVVAVLVGRFVAPQIAAFKVIVGALVCTILFLAARGAEQHPAGEGFVVDTVQHRNLVWSPTINDLLMRALAVAVVGAGVLGTGISQAGFEGTSTTLAPAAWLAVLGTLLLVLGRATFPVGIGLLTFLTGFEIFYSPLDSSPILLGVLAAVHILLALAIAYGISHDTEEG
jgi:hypothetical protein